MLLGIWHTYFLNHEKRLVMDKPEILRPWTWSRQVVNEGAEIPLKRGCFAVLVTNITGVGGSIVLVEGYPLNPPLVAGANGESWSVGGPEGTEISKSTLEIRFSTNAGLAFVQQAYYTDIIQ